MVTELIPVVDLRFLSQSELATLALSSPNAFDLRRCDDVVVPKIDRSVFNESAGSRKQTYSRIYLAPPKTDSASHHPTLPRRRGRPRSIPLQTAVASPSTSAPPPSDNTPTDPDRRENLLIASFLRQLFSREDLSSQTLTPNKESSAVCTNENNDGWNNILAAAEEAQKALVLAEDRDRETLNSKGEPVDLVALGQMEDPFGEELRRKTSGLKTEEQLLGFLSCVEGQWGSRRKRRRFVDASLFGDALPRSWKLLLGLKRKEGVAWLDCRRYISPNGHQFMSCKEVSSYILSLQGSMPPIFDRDNNNNSPQLDKMVHESNAGQIHQTSISNGSSSFSSSTPVSLASSNHEKQPEATTSCYDATPISYISHENGKQQPLSAQQKRAKRRRLGKTFVDGVILKDGKFECQFCHKTFTERHRYNGHIGAHVRYQGLTAKALVDESNIKKITDQSSWAIVPYISSEKDASMNDDASHNSQCFSQLNDLQVNRGQPDSSTVKSSDDTPSMEIIEEKIAVEMKCNNCVDSTFPSAGDLNATPAEESSPGKPGDSEVNDSAMANDEASGVIHEEEYLEEDKPKASSDVIPLFSIDLHIDASQVTNTTARSFSACKLDNEVHIPSSASKSEEAGSPEQANLDGGASNDDEVLNPLYTIKMFDDITLVASDADNNSQEAINGGSIDLSTSKSSVLERSDYNTINYTAHNAVSTSDYMDVDANSCYDLSLSLMDIDMKAKNKHNETNSYPGNSTSEFEKYNDKLVVEIENNSFSLSGNQPSNRCMMFEEDISAHADDSNVERRKSSGGQDANEFLHHLIDKDVVLESNINSYTFASFSSEQSQAVDVNIDCAFGTDINEALDEIDKPINELEFFFSRSSHDGNDGNELIENDEESEAVRIGLSSSWLHSTNVLPVLDMLPDQCGGELNEISHKNENLQAFEELRLGTIEPSDFALFTGQDSRTTVEPSISLGYATELEDQHCSSFQLGWSISLGSIDDTSGSTSVCVWCSTEFRHEHDDDEPHSEALGFICSSCKAKFSGP